MLRILFLLVLTSCTLGSSQFGGKKTYHYDSSSQYDSEELSNISRDLVSSFQRNPRQIDWARVFNHKYPIKSVSTFTFESIIQPTRAAIAGFDKVYLSPKGKQLLTERLLRVWEEAFSTVTSSALSYVPMEKIYSDLDLHSKYGLEVKDYGAGLQEGLETDDVFFKERGKSLSSLSLFQPSFSRDLSILLVPAYQLFGGPRGNEFQKYYVAETMEMFQLDALFSVMAEIDWQASRVDKITQQSVHQKAMIKLKVTPIVSYKEFARRLEEQGVKVEANMPNLNWGAYESAIEIPVELDKISKDSSLEEIESLLLRPILKTYTDICVMMAHRIHLDFKRMKIE